MTETAPLTIRLHAADSVVVARAKIEAAGFTFEAASDVNANPKDRPTPDDFVWRLPPAYSGARDDAEKRAAADAIGESNRMTLRFRKKE